MAEITWVNHASFVLDQGQVGLMCDLWMEGSVFNNGWNLLSPTRWRYEDFRRLTHIWFSHEHPDHFFPPNLRKIPEDARSQLEVLYQATKDRKVLNYCRQLGFRTRELRPFEWTEIGDSIRIKCGTFPPYDSWLLIDVPGFRILNLNDCQVKSPAIARDLFKQTGSFDVLLSQFSYACWVGNPDDLESRQEAGRRCLRQISYQIDAFRPKYFIPSASYVLFSHEENCYLNDSINRVDAVVQYFRDRTELKVLPMYPGDKWVVGAKHDGSEALRKYREDYERGVVALHKSESVTWSELEQIAKKHLANLRTKNDWLFVRLAALPPVRLFCTTTVFITDYNEVVLFDIFRGLTRKPGVTRFEADISMSSASLAFVLKNDFGFDTLYVNACFRASQEGFERFERSVSLALLNNTGRRFGPALLFDPAFFYKAVSHFFPWIRAALRWRSA